MRRIIFCLFLMAAGCTDVPELGGRVAPDLRAAPFPKLLPLEKVLAQKPPAQQQSEEIQSDLAARVARLQARANALRGSVVDEPTRRRLSNGVNSDALVAEPAGTG